MSVCLSISPLTHFHDIFYCFSYLCFFINGPIFSPHFCLYFAERNDLSYPPVIATLSPLGHAADFLAPGDRLHQIDGISTIGLTNQHIMSMLCGGGTADRPAVVEIEYSLPEYSE